MFKSAVCALALFAVSTCVIAAKAGGSTGSPIGMAAATAADKTAAFKPLQIMICHNYACGNGSTVTMVAQN